MTTKSDGKYGRCGRCDARITKEEREMGWPGPSMLDDCDICPSCYGGDAYCFECGELLRGDVESSLCEACESNDY